LNNDLSVEIKTVNFSDIEIPLAAVKRRLGYPSGESEITGQVKDVFDAMLEKAGKLIQPVGVYRYCRIQNRTAFVLTLAGTDLYIESEKVAALLRNSDNLVIFYTTIGPDLGQAALEYSNSGQLTESMILDAIGSETVDEVADRLHHQYIFEKVKKKGYNVTARFSPGYGDWSLKVQPAMAMACKADLIDITIDESCFMSPVKSVSAVFGLESGF